MISDKQQTVAAAGDSQGIAEKINTRCGEGALTGAVAGTASTALQGRQLHRSAGTVEVSLSTGQ